MRVNDPVEAAGVRRWLVGTAAAGDGLYCRPVSTTRVLALGGQLGQGSQTAAGSPANGQAASELVPGLYEFSRSAGAAARCSEYRMSSSSWENELWPWK